MTDAPVSEQAAVTEAVGAGLFQVRVSAGGHDFWMDEPVTNGGLDSGPSPFDLLRAALASCTLMTIKAYAERKGWPTGGLRVRVTHHKGEGGARDRFDRVIDLGDVTDEQRDRLAWIADRCPVHLLLDKGADSPVTLAG